MNMPDLKIELIPGNRDGLCTLKLTGPFTLSDVFEFQGLVRENHPPATIIDLTDVPYIDSAALGAILGFHVSCQRHGFKYALVGVSQRLATMFNVAGVQGMLTICPTLDQAEVLLANAATA